MSLTRVFTTTAALLGALAFLLGAPPPPPEPTSKPEPPRVVVRGCDSELVHPTLGANADRGHSVRRIGDEVEVRHVPFEEAPMFDAPRQPE